MANVTREIRAWERENGCADAPEELDRTGLNIREKHVLDAIAKDGHHCVMANCINMALDAKKCFIYKGTARVQLDEGGIVYRFMLPPDAIRNVVQPLDEGRPEDIVPGIYYLRSPKGGDRRGEAARRRSERLKREAAILAAGGTLPPKKRRPGRKRPVIGRLPSAHQAWTES